MMNEMVNIWAGTWMVYNRPNEVVHLDEIRKLVEDKGAKFIPKTALRQFTQIEDAVKKLYRVNICAIEMGEVRIIPMAIAERYTHFKVVKPSQNKLPARYKKSAANKSWAELPGCI